jgi:hypothetical protein
MSDEPAPVSEITCAVAVLAQNIIRQYVPGASEGTILLAGRSISYRLEALIDSAAPHLKTAYIAQAKEPHRE